MQFSNSFSIPLPLEEAWALILDIPTVLPCLPGAELKEVVAEGKYKGAVSVRLGPVKLAFEGVAEIVEKDELNHIAYLKGSGTDPKGRGSASSNFNFQLTKATDNQTDVVVTTELALSGAVAQYGRGSGMITEVAAQIMKQFEANLARLVEGGYHLAEQPENKEPIMGYAASQESVQSSHLSSPQLSNPTAAPMAVAYSTDISVVQAQAILAQAQATLAQTQAILLKTGLLGPEKRKEFKAAELNMFKIGLSAFWSRMKYVVSKLFSK